MHEEFCLTLCYDGTRYRGWQRQGNTGATIQGKVEAVLSRALASLWKRPPPAGRTRESTPGNRWFPSGGTRSCPVRRSCRPCGTICRRISARRRLRRRRPGFMPACPAGRKPTSTGCGTARPPACSSAGMSAAGPNRWTRRPWRPPGAAVRKARFCRVLHRRGEETIHRANPPGDPHPPAGGGAAPVFYRGRFSL